MYKNTEALWKVPTTLEAAFSVIFLLTGLQAYGLHPNGHDFLSKGLWKKPHPKTNLDRPIDVNIRAYASQGRSDGLSSTLDKSCPKPSGRNQIPILTT